MDHAIQYVVIFWKSELLGCRCSLISHANIFLVESHLCVHDFRIQWYQLLVRTAAEHWPRWGGAEFYVSVRDYCLHLTHCTSCGAFLSAPLNE